MPKPPFQIHIGPNIRKSPYFDSTVADGVQSFSVYNHMFIPGNFGDPDAEYDRLINGVAMWDVGAQRQVELNGSDAAALAQYLTTRDISLTKVGQGRYVPICDYNGMLINDPVLVKLSDTRLWLSIADSDIALWAEAIARERGMDVRIFEPDVSPLAIQGPKAMDVASDLFGDWVGSLSYFGFRQTDLDGIPLVVARSGWSKQGGVELYLMDSSRGADLWQRVKDAGQSHGIGPGAPNDVERLESGLVSYGADARHTMRPVNPFEIGLGKLVDLESADDFIGRAALRSIWHAGVRRHRVGVVIEGEPIAGNQNSVDIIQNDKVVGFVGEVAYSKRVGATIGIAIVEIGIGEQPVGLTAYINGSVRSLRLAELPFVMMA